MKLRVQPRWRRHGRSQFDRLYLVKPDPTISDEEEGEKPELPPENDWETMNMEDVDVEASIAALKEGLPFQLSSQLDLFPKEVSSQEWSQKGSKSCRKQSIRKYLGST